MQSIAAHAEARRLDPNVPTSIEQTLLMAGNIDRLVDDGAAGVVAGADDGIRVIGLGLAGRRDEARRMLNEMRQSSRIPLFERWIDYLAAWIDRRVAEMDERRAARGDPLKSPDDPEAIFQEGWFLFDVGEYRMRARLRLARGRSGYSRRRRSSAGRSSTPSATIRRSRTCSRARSGPAARPRGVPRRRRRAAAGRRECRCGVSDEDARPCAGQGRAVCADCEPCALTARVAGAA